jgi:hypothetical protein
MTVSDPAAIDPCPAPSLREWPLVLLLAFAVSFWSWLAFAVHTIPIVGGEWDQYVERAAGLLRGDLPADVYHPAGFTLLIAALAWVGVDAFVAARIWAVAFGALLLAASYGLARVWFDRATSFFTALAVGASEYVLVGAVQACPDVPAAALATLALYLWARGPLQRIASGAFVLGVAWTLRAPALWIGAAVLPLLVADARLRQWRVLAGAAAAFVAGTLPQLVVSWLQYGSPVHSEYSHNLVLKYHHHFDAAAWVADREHLGEIFRAECTSWIVPALADCATFVATGLFGCFVDPGAIATMLSVLVAIACAIAWRSKDAGAASVAAGGIAYGLLLAATFQPTDRLLIPLAAPMLISLLLLLRRVAGARRTWLTAATAAAVALGSVLHAPRAIDTFRRAHPYAEVAAEARLQAELGPPLRCYHNPFFDSAHEGDPWQWLRRRAKSMGAEFFLLDPAKAPVACARLEGSPLPPDFEIRERRPVLVLVYRPTAEHWAESAGVEPRGDEVHLSLTVADRPELAPCFACGFLMRRGTGAVANWELLALPPGAGRTFELALPRARFDSGPHRFVPVLMMLSGTMLRAEPIDVSW